MFIGLTSTASTNSVLRSGIQLALPLQNHSAPQNGVGGGSCRSVYKHTTPNGVKPFSSTLTNNDGMKVTGEIAP